MWANPAVARRPKSNLNHIQNQKDTDGVYCTRAKISLVFFFWFIYLLQAGRQMNKENRAPGLFVPHSKVFGQFSQNKLNMESKWIATENTCEVKANTVCKASAINRCLSPASFPLIWMWSRCEVSFPEQSWNRKSSRSLWGTRLRGFLEIPSNFDSYTTRLVLCCLNKGPVCPFFILLLCSVRLCRRCASTSSVCHRTRWFLSRPTSSWFTSPTSNPLKAW